MYGQSRQLVGVCGIPAVLRACWAVEDDVPTLVVADLVSAGMLTRKVRPVERTGLGTAAVERTGLGTAAGAGAGVFPSHDEYLCLDLHPVI